MNAHTQLLLPTIPEKIVVHLGEPGVDAPNVEVGFIDYIANVASREVYPTWPENALIANVIAETTFALNRLYTEFYRSKGYDFDITSSTRFDQAFDPGKAVYDNIAMIADMYFNGYIRRNGNVEPLFALYCDGIVTTCGGLSQTGSVELANRGLTPIEILRYYYGEDIEFVENVDISTKTDTSPKIPLRLGSLGNEVEILQTRLNRISANYPSIPKIPLADGIFGTETESAVRAFQEVFGLETDGIVGPATWYEIRQKYNAVKKLNELLSEGINYDEVSLQLPEDLRPGMRGLYVSGLQYFLNFVSAFTTDFTDIPITGEYDAPTEQLVADFQNYAGLVPTGIADQLTWSALFDAYRGIITDFPPSAFEGIARPFPGIVLRLGSRGEDVRELQSYINVLSGKYAAVPTLAVDGIYGTQTRDAIYAIQSLLGLTVDGTVDPLTWAAIADTYNDIVAGTYRGPGQFPGTLEREDDR
ncbi:MAG: peptidoglycan-binding protein [Clostridia bacterium]|nr:peptidoglycan-binding protein [Clostridia bacterium]